MSATLSEALELETGEPRRSSPGAALDERRAARLRLVRLALSWGVLVGAWFYAPVVRHGAHGATVCAFRLASGFPCPGCGMTRALCAFVHGDFAAALRLNALVVPAVLIFAFYPVVELTRMARGAPPLALSRAPRRAMVAATVLVFAYHACRVAWWLADGTIAREYWPRSLPGMLTSLVARLLSS